MRGRILLGLGLAVGYVLGARAGRGAYDRLRYRADRVAHSPQVTRAVDAAVHAAEQAAPRLTGAAQGLAGAGAPSTAAATLREGTRASAPAEDDEGETATD